MKLPFTIKKKGTTSSYKKVPIKGEPEARSKVIKYLYDLNKMEKAGKVSYYNLFKIDRTKTIDEQVTYVETELVPLFQKEKFKSYQILSKTLNVEEIFNKLCDELTKIYSNLLWEQKENNEYKIYLDRYLKVLQENREPEEKDICTIFDINISWSLEEKVNFINNNLLQKFDLKNFASLDTRDKLIYTELNEMLNAYKKYLEEEIQKKVQQKPKTRTEEDKKVIEDLQELLVNYHAMMNKGFVNYYTLFKLDSKKSNEELLKDSRMIYLSKIIRLDIFAKYGINITGDVKNTFVSLVNTFNSFINWTLTSEENRKEYDESLAKYIRLNEKPLTQPKKEEKQPIKTQNKTQVKYDKNYRYIYDQVDVDITEMPTQLEHKLNLAIVENIKKYGITKTVGSLMGFLKHKNVNALTNEMQVLFNGVDKKSIKELISLLNEKYPSNNIQELSETIITKLLSRKINVLSQVMYNTSEQKNMDSVLTGLEEIIKTGISSTLVSGTDKSIGREKLMLEVDEDIIKFLLALNDNTNSILVDCPELLQDEYNDKESLNNVATTLVNLGTKKKGFRK